MKLANFKVGNEIHLGIKVEQGIIDASSVALSIDEVIAGGEKVLKKLSELIEKEDKIIPEDKVVYGPCVTNPEKILCVGLNYLSHGEECNMNIPTSPVLFSKFNNSLAAHKQVINLPKSAYKFDYEAELVIVLGKEAIRVSKEEALSCVFGYTTGNDLSARDLQFVSGQWLLGKTCDGFAPIGPYLITGDELDPNNLDIKCEVNGEVRQASNTSDMIFDCATIISYISNYMTLKPGDIIFSGTPSGVMLGYPEGEQNWLKAGDKVTISIENIGTLVNVLK